METTFQPNREAQAPTPGEPPFPPSVPPPVPPPPIPDDDEGTPTAPPVINSPQPKAIGSRALELDGRTFAFGGRWRVYRQAGRRQRSEALRGAGASHWLRVEAGGTTQIALFTLAEERGRMFAATEAVRCRFGGDFMGVFEIRTDSIDDGYWLVALSDDVVLADTLFDSTEAAKEACGRLLAPGRRFGTVRMPEGFSDSTTETCSIGDFLDLSRVPLARVPSPRRSLAAAAMVTLATLASATVAHALLGQERKLSEPETPTVEVLRIAPPEPFTSICEETVASGLYAAAADWSLASASCYPGFATLAFRHESGGQEEALRQVYPGLSIGAEGRDATAHVPLPISDEEAGDLWNSSKARKWLRHRLRLLDRGHLMWQDSSGQGFRFRTQLPLDQWLAVFKDSQGLEITRLALLPDSLVWEVEGRLHSENG